jgi:hypothetical protein
MRRRHRYGAAEPSTLRADMPSAHAVMRVGRFVETVREAGLD